MIAECLHDREQIERFLRRDPGLHIYGLGDLDDRFWPFTTWYGGRDGGDLQALFLLPLLVRAVCWYFLSTYSMLLIVLMLLNSSGLPSRRFLISV